MWHGKGRRSCGSWGAMALAGSLGACAEAADASPSARRAIVDPSDPKALLAECGGSLDTLLARSTEASASYSETLETWWSPGDSCGLGVFSGRCSDGKRLLYRNGGFTSEIRYYEGEALVGAVLSGDVGACPSACPFSTFFGPIEAVGCDVPTFDELCPGSAEITPPEALVLPFANGQAPGGCELLEH